MKTTKYKNRFFLKFFISLCFLFSSLLLPLSVQAEIAETEINGEIIKASSEFLRDLDYETWQLVAYKDSDANQSKLLRVIGYPGSLRIDHPLQLRVDSGRKTWFLDDKTLLNDSLVNDSRQAAAEFDLEFLISDISKNRPLRLSLEGVFSELPVPPFLVEEWRSLN
tara:strand:- start:6019 stop:6516 length:498 start_codon:yes stop_codon:yes gene_type:complete